MGVGIRSVEDQDIKYGMSKIWSGSGESAGNRETQEFPVADEQQTISLAQDVALALEAGDIVFLIGQLGVGKTTFARAMIRAISGMHELEVPSPTYTIEQTYETEPPVRHFDLYRLEGSEELAELGIDENQQGSITLVEWPEIAFDMIPDPRVAISINITGPNEREIAVDGSGSFLTRFNRSREIRAFIESAGAIRAARSRLFGDASTRSYELIRQDNDTTVLMNAPKQPDGPIIKDGKAYSQIAHLAEEVSAFAGVDNLLRAKGFNAPGIYAHEFDQGLLLLEYLGAEQVVDKDRRPIEARYLASVETIAQLHQHEWPNTVSLAENRIHQLNKYDHKVIDIEVQLLIDWYMPEKIGRKCSPDEFDRFSEIWSNLSNELNRVPKTLVLRDFHSPNIIWQKGRTGIDRTGLIDFQDALIGPESYDLASLAQDARVDISEQLEDRLVDHYLSIRSGLDSNYDEDSFRKSYAIMAAQRATKILGIFVRLHKRDNKPGYLKHIPRIMEYLERSFRHPVLKDYRDWFYRTINGSK